MSAAKLMGLTVGAQVACERGDLKGIRERARSLASLKPAEFSSAAGDFFANRMFAVSVSATMGVGGGASLAMTDFTELSRHTLRTDQLGAFARSWIKDQRGL